MRVLVQWGLRTPADWEAIDPHADPQAWAKLPKRARPSGVQTPNNQRGWIVALNCQGLIAESDVIAVEPVVIDGEPCIRLTEWDDTSQEPGYEQARVWTIKPLAPDPALGGRLNTRQSVVCYYGDTLYGLTMLDPSRIEPNRTVRHWSEFTPPAESLRRYGVLLSDTLWQQHRARRSQRGWADWR